MEAEIWSGCIEKIQARGYVDHNQDRGNKNDRQSLHLRENCQVFDDQSVMVLKEERLSGDNNA